ncbi:MAG TPA: T9SS type A sorting domain-containing protein [Flavisolibacter sp.]
MKTAALLTALVLMNCVTGFCQQIQSVANATGGSFTNNLYSFDWSVGELALVSTATSADGGMVLTNGFLQPGHRNTSTDPGFTDDEVRITPNPTFNTIQVNLLTQQQGNVRIQVYDTHGRMLVSKSGVNNGLGNIHKIDLLPYAAGTYFLRITLDPYPGSVKKSGSYKIVKF